MMIDGSYLVGWVLYIRKTRFAEEVCRHTKCVTMEVNTLSSDYEGFASRSRDETPSFIGM